MLYFAAVFLESLERIHFSCGYTVKVIHFFLILIKYMFIAGIMYWPLLTAFFLSLNENSNNTSENYDIFILCDAFVSKPHISRGD